MTPMIPARLTLLLLLYVSLDFASPLLPGAVSFADGAFIEAYRSTRLRDTLTAATPWLEPALAGVTPVRPEVRPVRRPAPDHRPTWRGDSGRAHPSLCSPASPLEDH
jgi:hypothetical protein